MTVSDRQLRQFAHEAADHLGALCRDLDLGVLARITEYSAGVPAGALAPSGSNGAHSDPTARAALGRQRDQAAHDRVELERFVLQALERVRRARDIAARYPEPAVGADPRAELAALNSGEPSCQSCARVAGPAGTPRWEPVDSRLRNPTVARGVLDAPMWLCRWCNDRAREWGRLPTPDELTKHHRGIRVPWPTDVERMP